MSNIPKIFVVQNAAQLSEQLPNFLTNCQQTLLNEGYNIISLTSFKNDLVFLCNPLENVIEVEATVLSVKEDDIVFTNPE
jgi:hypothetical protein